MQTVTTACPLSHPHPLTDRMQLTDSSCQCFPKWGNFEWDMRATAQHPPIYFVRVLAKHEHVMRPTGTGRPPTRCRFQVKHTQVWHIAPRSAPDPNTHTSAHGNGATARTHADTAKRHGRVDQKCMPKPRPTSDIATQSLPSPQQQPQPQPD